MSAGLVTQIRVGSSVAPVLLVDLVAIGLAFAALVVGHFEWSAWTIRLSALLGVVSLRWLISPMSIRWALLGPIVGMVLALYAWVADPAQRLRARLGAARGAAALAIGLSSVLVVFGKQNQKSALTLVEIVQNGYDLPWARSNYLAAIIMLGAAGAIVLLASVRRTDRLLAVSAIGFCVPALLLTGSRTQLLAWLVLVAGTFWTTMKNGRKRIQATLAVVIGTLALVSFASRYIEAISSMSSATNSGFSTLDLRFVLWRQTINGAWNSVVGNGLVPVRAKGRVVLAHDAALQIWFSFGWLGLLIAGTIVASTIRIMRQGAMRAATSNARMRCTLDKVALATIVVSGLAENTIFMHAYDLVFWPLLSLIVASAAVSHLPLPSNSSQAPS